MAKTIYDNIAQDIVSSVGTSPAAPKAKTPFLDYYKKPKAPPAPPLSKPPPLPKPDKMGVHQYAEPYVTKAQQPKAPPAPQEAPIIPSSWQDALNRLRSMGEGILYAPRDIPRGIVSNITRTALPQQQGVSVGSGREMTFNTKSPEVEAAERAAAVQRMGLDPALVYGPQTGGEAVGSAVAGFAGALGPAIPPQEMAQNPLYALGPQESLLQDIVMTQAIPGVRQAIQGVKGYPKKLVDTAPRLVPERQAMGLAKKAPSIDVQLFNANGARIGDAVSIPETQVEGVAQRLKNLLNEPHLKVTDGVAIPKVGIARPIRTPKGNVKAWDMGAGRTLTTEQLSDEIVKAHAPSPVQQARAVPPAAKAGQAKEPWEMSNQEWAQTIRQARQSAMDAKDYETVDKITRQFIDQSYGADMGGKGSVNAGHRYAVERAHAAGKPVPAEVLAEYGLEAKPTELPKVQQPPLSKAAPTLPKEAFIPDEAPSIEGVGFPQREPITTVEGAGERPVLSKPVVQPEQQDAVAKLVADFKAKQKPVDPIEAQVAAMRGKGPPSKPPTNTPTGAVPTPQPKGIEDSLAQAKAVVERDRPGIVTRLVDRTPGLKQVQRALHPAVGMPEHILTAHVGGGSAQSTVSNRLRADVTQVLEQLDNAFGKDANTAKNVAPFIGTPAERVPFSGTLYDVMQRPDLYALTPTQKQLLTDIQAKRSATFNELKQAYKMKVREFPVPEGAVHLGNVSKDEVSLSMAGDVQSAIRSGAAKERFYATGADRYLHDKAKYPNNPEKWFDPVTDVGQLMSNRADKELAKEAGQNTFKAGLGGKTKLEVLQETQPELAKKMLGLKRRLESLRGTAGRLSEKQQMAIDDFLVSPLEDIDLTHLKADMEPEITRGPRKGMELAEANREIQQVRAQIAALQKGWRTAKTNPYVLVSDGNLYQYFPASEVPIIRRLVKTSDSATLRTLDNLRATAFGGDLSPASIQAVTSILLDPVRTGKSIVETGPKKLFSEAALAADMRANPESWARFTRATGLNPLGGQAMGEFGTGFIGKIPKVGKFWDVYNDTVYRPQNWTLKRSFDSIYEGGLKMGLSSEQAAAIAADDVTKLVPNYSYRRMGLSQAESARYRAVLTSVSFLTQPAALITDATKGLVKLGTLQKLSPSESYAVKRVLTLVAAVETISVTSNAAYAKLNGRDVNEAIKDSVNPASGYFMSLVLPNGSRIGMGGPYRSMIKAVWPREVEGLGPVPVPFAGVVTFARGKMAPGIRIGFDLVRNQDYQGKKIRTDDAGFAVNVLQGLEYIAEGSAPLTLGSAAEQVRHGEPENIAPQVISQFAGVNMSNEDIPYTMKIRWEQDFKPYNAIPTDPIEAKAKNKLNRTQYREKHPDVDAKLFITGQVGSIQSQAAANQVVRLVQENKIDPQDIKGIQQNMADQEKKKRLGVRDTTLTYTDKLVRMLSLQTQKTMQTVQPNEPPIPVGAGRRAPPPP